MVGIATFDSSIHFYNLKRALQQVGLELPALGYHLYITASVAYAKSYIHLFLAAIDAYSS